MQFKTIVTVITTLLAPAAVWASDSAVLDGQSAPADVIARMHSGDLRLIYLSAPPPAPEGRVAPFPTVALRPPPRPTIVMADRCGWPDIGAALIRIRQAFGQNPIWLVEPASDSCEAGTVKAAFDAAAAAPERERLQLLLSQGMRLSKAEAPAAAAPLPADQQAQPASGGRLGGKLLISALPADTSLGGGAPVVIGALAPTEIATPPEPPETAPDAETEAGAPSETASGGTPMLSPALVRRPGLPEPAVVVGELASLLAEDKRRPTGVPRDVRDRIREIDPAFFSTLLEMGSFDPQSDAYVAAIQTELAEMECYRGSIDGDWGQGSLAALGRYFSELGAAQAAEAPGPALYREIATHRRVTCPAPVVAVRTNPTTTARGGGNTGGTRSPGGTPSRPSGGNVQVGPNVSVGPNVRVNGGQPAQQTAPSGPPRINSDLANGIGSGVIK